LRNIYFRSRGSDCAGLEYHFGRTRGKFFFAVVVDFNFRWISRYRGAGYPVSDKRKTSPVTNISVRKSRNVEIALIRGESRISGQGRIPPRLRFENKVARDKAGCLSLVVQLYQFGCELRLPDVEGV